MKLLKFESQVPFLEKEDVYCFIKFGFISISDWNNFEIYFNEYKNKFWFQAAVNGHLNMIKFLIEVGMKIEIKNLNGKTAFIAAVANGHFEVADFLFEKGANIHTGHGICGDSLLMWPSERGHFDIVKFLIEVGVDINENTTSGYTALMWAVAYDHLDITRFLVDNGADIEAKNNKGNTALEIAISKNYIEFANYLKQKINEQRAA